MVIEGTIPNFLDGSGSGYGYGYGYGDGDGDWDGDGYGSGSGYGDGDYWLKTIKYFANKWTEAQRKRLSDLQALGTTIAFWLSDKSGRACNGGSNSPVAPGTIEEVSGPLRLCSRNTLHATVVPTKWSGERWWVVAMHGEVVKSDDKMGALKREIIGECLRDGDEKGQTE